MYRRRPHPPPPILTERNLDRLGFFSVQTRLPLEPSWESQFQVGGRTVHVRGEGTRGRPHGADTDIMLGVEQLFINAGSPDDNWLHTTPNALREAALMTKNGRAFARIREGLLRIWATGFIAREGWVDANGKPIRFNSAFRLFEELRYWDRETDDLPELLPDARLSVRLSSQLASSIRAGFTHALRREVLTHLEQPHARALYRLVEAHRYADDGGILKTLRVDLMDWRAGLGIREDRASKVLRTLDAAHEVIAAGYLADLHVTGRGQTQQIEYVFRQEHDPDPALVRLLREHRVGAPRAVQLAAEYPERVEEAIRYYSYVRQQGSPVRNPGGFIADLIVNPGKYELPENLTPPGEKSVPSSGSRAAEQSEQQAQRQHEAETVRRQALSPEEQWQEVGKTLLLMLRTSLTPEERAVLETKCRSGQWSAVQLASQGAKAAATLTMHDFVADLKRDLMHT